MKYYAFAAIIALSACQTTTDVAMDARPMAVEQFFDKTLTNAGGTIFTFSPDGKVGGVFRGEEIIGEYTSTEYLICSTYSEPEAFVGIDICSAPVVSGDQVWFKRTDGSESGPYTITDS